MVCALGPHQRVVTAADLESSHAVVRLPSPDQQRHAVHQGEGVAEAFLKSQVIIIEDRGDVREDPLGVEMIHRQRIPIATGGCDKGFVVDREGRHCTCALEATLRAVGQVEHVCELA